MNKQINQTSWLFLPDFHKAMPFQIADQTITKIKRVSIPAPKAPNPAIISPLRLIILAIFIFLTDFLRKNGTFSNIIAKIKFV